MPDEPSPAPDPAPDATQHPYYGKTIARCEIAELLGQGHYAKVFKARYEPLGKDIALKLLSERHAALADRRERFILEARAIAQLDHAHIVKVLDVVEDEDVLCILMEYVEGETLRVRMKREGALPPRKAVRIALQMARALETAHAAKVIHRDIKPGNVILTKRGEDVKVVDFGLAGQQKGAGTPVYMSPEACRGKRIDEKSDVYALGVCLYQMLVGHPPYQGENVKAILRAHVQANLVPPSQAKEDLGTAFDDVVKKLLVPSKGYRPTAAESIELLQPLLEDKKAGGASRGRKGGRRRGPAKKGAPLPLIVGGVGVALILAFGGLLLFGGDDEPAPNGGEDPATPPGVASTGNGTGAVSSGGSDPESTDPPPDVVEDPAKGAYAEVEEWIAANPDAFEKYAARWKQVADAHPDSPLGRKAKMNAIDAEAAVEQKKLAAEREEKRKAFREKMQAERAEIDKRLASWDFAGASELLAGHQGLPDESIAKLRKKKWRVDYLGKEFQKRINEGLTSGGKVKAQKIDPKSGPDERLVSIDDKGVLTDAGRTIPWAEVQPDHFFEKVAKWVVSQTKAEGNLFLAILAAEIGLPDQSQMHRQQIDMFVDPDSAKKMINEYFAE